MCKRTLIAALLLAVGLGAAGCPAKTRRTLVPAIPKTPTSGDSQARARFDQAQRRFERDDHQVATEFEAIADKYPNDPIAPHALLYAGMAAVRASDYGKAVAILDKLDGEPAIDAAVRARGSLFLGVALGYRGHHARALPHLRRGERAIADAAERGEWLAAIAGVLGRGSAPLEAMVFYDRWHKIARSAERAYIVARLRVTVAAADARAAQTRYDRLSDLGTPAAAILGMRVAADLRAQGRAARADKVLRDTASSRQRIGLAVDVTVGAGGADSNMIGAVLALSGRGARVGDLAMRGLAIASGSFGTASAGGPKPFLVAVHDSKSKPGVAQEGVSELAARGAIGVVGPIHRRSVASASAKAAALGIPLVTLDQRSRASTSPFVFHAVHSAEDRARSLARHAYGVGVRDFAILAPANGYGRVVGGAFGKEVVKLGGTVVVTQTYDAKATSFGKAVRKLRKPWQALFIPDQASRLALIAPSLAAGNFVARPWTAKRPRRGRKILLLSTAESLTPRYLRNAGRYSAGAVFAPGFYPDRFDPIIRSFVDRYEAAFRRVPTVFDAYAYDAAVAMRAAIASGARTRGRLGTALGGVRADGVTGQIRFGGDRRRADDGLLYRVQPDDTGTLQIRVQRKTKPPGA